MRHFILQRIKKNHSQSGPMEDNSFGHSKIQNHFLKDTSDNWLAIQFNRLNFSVSINPGETEWWDVRGHFLLISNIPYEENVLMEDGESYRLDALYLSGLTMEHFQPLHNGVWLVESLKGSPYFIDLCIFLKDIEKDNARIARAISRTNNTTQIKLLLFRKNRQPD